MTRASFTVCIMTGLVLVTLASSAAAQVNTEAMAAAASDDGWAFQLDVGVTLKRGNTDSLNIGSASQLRFLTLHSDPDLEEGGEPWFRDRFLLAADFTYETASGDRVDNEAFAHVRWTRMWIPRLGHEVFSQIEYAEFRRLNRRVLLGAGGRVVIANEKLVQLWVGTGYFVEFEDYDIEDLEPVDFEGEPINHRWNNYLSLKINDADEKIQWLNTLYYQPRFDAFEDFQILYESALSVVIVGPLSFGVHLELQHDAEPVPTIESTDITVKNVLRVAL